MIHSYLVRARRSLMTSPLLVFMFPIQRTGQTLLCLGCLTSQKISYHSAEEQKLQPALFIDSCAFPSEAWSAYKQDLCVFSFHSLWVILAKAFAAVPVTSGRETVRMLWFQVPLPPLFFKLKKTSSPHYILVYIRALMLIVYCNMMPSVYLAGVC